MRNMNVKLYQQMLMELGFEWIEHPGRIPYSRLRPERLRPRDEMEKRRQELFLYLKDWLAPLEEWVKVGFRHFAGDRDPMEVALCEAWKDAVFQEANSVDFFPTFARISKGDLTFEDKFEVVYDTKTSELHVSWGPELPKTMKDCRPAADDDRLMMLVYETWGGEAYGKVYGACRGEGTDSIVIPPSDDPMHYSLFLAFTSADGTSESNTLPVDQILWEQV